MPVKKIFLITVAAIVLQTAFTQMDLPPGGGNPWNDQEQQDGDIYVCMPCGSDCDKIEFNNPGTCTQCKMELVKSSTVMHRNVEPAELCAFISKAGISNVLLLDVRTALEFEGRDSGKFGRLKNAINIPIQQLETRIKELAAYKDKEIVVYCSHSHRSPRASYLLNKKGFKKVTNMNGGMSVWTDLVKNECEEKLYIRQ